MRLKPLLWALCLCLKSVCADGCSEKWRQPALIPGEGSSCLLLFRKPSRKSKQSLPHLSQASLRSLLHPVCVPAICPHGSTVLRCACWVSKLPSFRDPEWHGPTLILWERVSLYCGWCRFVPEGQSLEGMGVGVYGKAQQKVSVSVICPQQAPLLLC